MIDRIQVPKKKKKKEEEEEEERKERKGKHLTTDIIQTPFMIRPRSMAFMLELQRRK